MSKKRRHLSAAGAVVLQGQGEDARVLVVHRPRYDDWTLPKGKPQPDEDLQVAAVRELEEETGLKVRLGAPLGTLSHVIDKDTKAVHWWLGTVRGGELHGGTPHDDHGQEVDRVEWWPAARAAAELSWPNDREVLARALALSPGHTVLLVRHAKAMLRKNWSGKDFRRPLSGRGRRQAKRLALLLDAYGVAIPVTSTSTRCVQTLQPYADRFGIGLVECPELSEEHYEDDPLDSERATVDLLNDARAQPNAPMALCGHRPVLPMMRHLLGLPDKNMLVAETYVVHHDSEGNQLAVEMVKPAF
ncbi:NUDIX hydrolase [Tessaracoccus sp. SD287]|uniref:NUDIX hydrolase n=1 Tax=Tessaracoccus sp. SD287 TaxID=2782008 RepID=UPI001A96DDE4|nr:NUDIX hydrolase [Tessaracoccus sp. SD287]MBO1031772.1 NUDIX hydrolase [Tessaracoccus sp. SD287]